MSIESQGYKQKAYKVTRSDDSKDLKKVLVGALAGAAAGSVIAGLFTQKGIETRKRISDESKHIASNIASNIKEKASTISGDIKDKFETTKESAAHLLEKGKQKVGISQPRYGYEKTAKTGSKVSESKVLLGALAVSVAGTVIWGLTSKKGKETRKRIGEGSKTLSKNIKEKVAVIADGIADTYEAAKEGAVDLLEKQEILEKYASTSKTSPGSRGSVGANW